MERLYNSTLEAYKSPWGASPAGSPVRFALTVPESCGFVEPRLMIMADGGEYQPLRMEYRGKEGALHRFEILFTPQAPGLFFYFFDLWRDYQKVWRGPLGEGLLSQKEGRPYQLTVYEAGFEPPSSFPGGVMYQIFPDRFFESEVKPMPFADRVYRPNKKGVPYYWPNEHGGLLNLDYYGGDLEGIRQKLPYLENLGVRWIYLNPIFEAHANHRYNTADYLKVDPLLGTNEDFSRLCADARKRGIGIILDGVFSHTGSDSLYFNREGRYGSGGAYHDPCSPYRSWYIFGQEYKCGYRSWWSFDTLPEVKENDPSYREFICGKGGVIDTWLSRGASGFRLDVADELPDDFIQTIRAAVKAHGEDKILLGEVWEDASNKEAYGQRRTYLLGKGLDSVMNYPFRNAILDFLKGGSARNAAEVFLSICENYPPAARHCLMNFLSTHDTERALTFLEDEPVGSHDRTWQDGRRLSPEKYNQGIQLMSMAYALLYTLPGVPCIYYGDEVGMQGYKDPFNRGYYDWDSTENRLKPVLRQLAELRRNCDAFARGDFTLIQARGGVLHYRRTGPTESAEIIVNRTNRLLCTKAFGRNTEVNPMGFTILVEDNKNL